MQSFAGETDLNRGTDIERDVPEYFHKPEGFILKSIGESACWLDDLNRSTAFTNSKEWSKKWLDAGELPE